MHIVRIMGSPTGGQARRTQQIELNTPHVVLDTLRVACSPMDDGHRTPHAVGRTTCQDGTRRASSWARRPSNIERRPSHAGHRTPYVACRTRYFMPETACQGLRSGLAATY